MKNKILYILLTMTIIMMPNDSHAAEDASWTSAKMRFEKLASENQCDQYWNLIWPWAKKGNIEARQLLFVLITFRLHMPEIYPPGRSEDLITLLRDAQIMAIHSIPDKTEELDRHHYQEIANEFILHTLPPSMERSKNFLGCWNTLKTSECTKIAVDDKLIPSWESYANEIDALIDKGMKSTCIKQERAKETSPNLLQNQDTSK